MMDRILNSIAPACGVIAAGGWALLAVLYALRAAGVLS